jgi:uncharacterized membrane protein
VFCAKCGLRQRSADAPPSATPTPTRDFMTGISARTASILCYIPMVGWIPSVIVLATPKFRSDRTVRFHAFQGLYLYVIWLIVVWVVDPLLSFGDSPGFHEMHLVKSLLKLGVFAAWIFMLVKTSQEETFHLPIVGELADRSVSEQR